MQPQRVQESTQRLHDEEHSNSDKGKHDQSNHPYERICIPATCTNDAMYQHQLLDN